MSGQQILYSGDALTQMIKQILIQRELITEVAGEIRTVR